MARVETLTAYKCRFCYLQRNNPMKETQREAIKSGETPDYSFADFIQVYLKHTKKPAIGENADRAISLANDKVIISEKDDLKMWHLMPIAGKQGRPVTIVNGEGKQQVYDSRTTALYDYHIFAYESLSSLIIIFHRQNGSGCKSVFLETANKILKQKGLKLEMDLIIPTSDEIKDAVPTKLTLQVIKRDISSDIADNMNTSRKKNVIIRDLGLNLEEIENNIILKILTELQLGKIDQESAFALIKTELNDSDDYNDAEIMLRVGKSRKKVHWSEFQNIIGAHDISGLLHEACKKSNDFSGELTKLANQYYWEIIESEEV